MPLETRKLGNTDITVPVAGLGTWGLCSGAYGPVSDAQVARTLERALELGATLLDMAPAWGEDGASERAVASVIGERRDELVLVTRAGRGADADGPHADFTDSGVRASCLASLGRLGTDYVDVLLLHNPDASWLEAEEPVATCEALVREGKVRTWGVSTSDVHCARSALHRGTPVLCLPHNLLRPELLWSVGEDVLAQGTGVLATSPLSHGLLSGRWSAHKGFPSNDHRHRRWTREALAARIAEVQNFRSSWLTGDMVSLASPALRFVASDPGVSAVVLGSKAPGQLELCVKALGEPPYPLPEGRVDALRALHGFA